MTVYNNALTQRVVELQKPLGYNNFRVQAEVRLLNMFGITSSTDERILEMHDDAVAFIQATMYYTRSVRP